MAAFDLIPEAQTACAPPRPFSTKRVEGFAPNPRDPRTPYALFADVVVATRLGLSTAASLATETAGFDGPGGYYSRSIASSPHCIYFSSKRGLEWARDVDGKMEGGILVPRREAEILGVATGLAPRADAGMPRASVYLTVLDERGKRGGVY